MSSTLKTTYLLIMFVVDTEVVKMFISLHTASISRDFPVPLGPYRRMPRGKGSPENKGLYLILEMFHHMIYLNLLLINGMMKRKPWKAFLDIST